MKLSQKELLVQNKLLHDKKMYISLSYVNFILKVFGVYLTKIKGNVIFASVLY
jgi:hypothetical protein